MKIFIIKVELYWVKVPKIARSSLQLIKCGIFSDAKSLLNKFSLLLFAPALVLGCNHYHRIVQVFAFQSDIDRVHKGSESLVITLRYIL